MGLGGILAQEEEGGARTIEYASRTLTSAERSYAATERKCFVWGVDKWREHLIDLPFTVVTGHEALVHIFRDPQSKGRIARWAIRIQDFQFTVVYRPSKLNGAADALSRIQEIEEYVQGSSALTASSPKVSAVKEVQEDICAARICFPPPTESKVIDWIYCNACRRWLHQHCVGISPEVARRAARTCPSQLEQR